MNKKLNKKIFFFIITFLLIGIISIYNFYNRYKYIIEKFNTINDNEGIIFYSYGTDYKRFKTLIDSALENNINIHVDGIGHKWLGFQDKLEKFHKFLENVDDNKIVMCIDAYDVMIFDNANNIKEKFLQFNKPIVISAEAEIWPDDIQDKYPNSDEFYKYANAGTYMGYAKNLKEMLNEFKKENYNCSTYYTDKTHDKADDQRCLTKYYLNNTNNVVLDHKQIIWSVAKRDDKENNRDDYEFTKFNKLYNKVSNTSSSILHINGWRDWYKELYEDKR